MGDKFWKAKERRIAKMFGTTRVGATGEHRCDFVNEWICGELFTWKIPQKLRQEHQQSLDENAATGGTKLPIAVAAAKGEQDMESLVFMKLKDFLDWFGGETQNDVTLP